MHNCTKYRTEGHSRSLEMEYITSY